MKEPWLRLGLLLAATLNVLGGAGALLDPAGHFATLYNAALSMDDPLQAFFYRATWINVMAWGIGYLLAAQHPGARLPILAAGGAGKALYFLALLALVLSGAGRPLLLVFGILDLLFAAFFAGILWRGRATP